MIPKDCFPPLHESSARTPKRQRQIRHLLGCSLPHTRQHAFRNFKCALLTRLTPQSVRGHRNAQELGTLSVSRSRSGLLRLKKAGDRPACVASWKFSSIWRLVGSGRLRGRRPPAMHWGQEAVAFGVGKHHSQVDSGSLKCGAVTMGGPQFG